MKKLNVLWPVDPFLDDPSVNQPLVDYLKTLNAKRPLSVTPVYILTPNRIDVLSRAAEIKWVDSYKEAAEIKIGNYVETLSLEFLENPVVLDNEKGSLGGASEALSEHALSQKSDLVILTTHARSGLNRFFTGSFTESLLIGSKTPVLVINPSAKLKEPTGTTLFATDFSTESSRVFREWVHHNPTQAEKVVIFHENQDYLSTYFGATPFLTTEGGKVEVAHLAKEEKDFKQSTADRWIETAKKGGIDAKLETGSNSADIVESILEHSKKAGADLIAMASQSGQIESAIAGSTLREVVRHAEIPVWVLHPSR